MTTSLEDLRLFCRIVETGSLRAAAGETGTDPSSVTRRLMALEQRVGVALVKRSRVRSTPTDAGQRYYVDLKRFLGQLETLEADVGGAAREPRGLLRVAAPSVFGARHVGPWLHELQLAAPLLAIDLLLSDRPLDLVEHGVDLAVRIGALADSSMTVIRLGKMRTAVVAAPAYLARHGTPKEPEDLARHALVLHAGPLQSEEIQLEGPRGRTAHVRCPSRFGVSSILGVLEAVLAGAGINAGPVWLFADAIERGDLVHVLPRWQPPTGTLQAVVPPGRYRPAKVTAALALLRDRATRLPGISRREGA
ncbi:MAG TPA: LysR family transcriptional regulator [Polyangiaceae bacterium]|nr:LysR family transcriptional regulator [Polyangiaceae bacterium]